MTNPTEPAQRECCYEWHDTSDECGREACCYDTHDRNDPCSNEEIADGQP